MKLSEVGKEIANMQGGGTVAIITDSNVAPLYLEVCEESIKASGLNTISLVIPAGEKNKSGEVYLGLLEKLASLNLTRSDGIAALGGGVVGDLAGFLAATYMRGIRFYQIPTTLLAMVDSSIGGKTGINLTSGKNLAGAFYLPSLIYRDIEVLSTLTEETFREGMAEVIKYAIAFDEELFNKLNESVVNKETVRTSTAGLEEIIERCVKIKNDIVAMDFRDNGARQLLNFGHTIGHAIEKLSDYIISHGDAVAKGMLRIAEAAEKMSCCDSDTLKSIESILIKYGFDLDIPYSSKDIFDIILSDKKRRGDEIEIVVPERIGKCRIKKMPLTELGEFF